MREILLTRGKVALVDDADYNWLNQWKWYAYKSPFGTFYAARHSSMKNSKRHNIRMHRLILNLKFGDKREGDHRNHNTLDNRRCNIRICNHSQNMRNQKLSLNQTSQFKGVSWNKVLKKWLTRIYVNGKTKHLGYFHNELFAAGVYDKAAKKYFSEFAYLNFN